MKIKLLFFAFLLMIFFTVGLRSCDPGLPIGYPTVSMEWFKTGTGEGPQGLQLHLVAMAVNALIVLGMGILLGRWMRDWETKTLSVRLGAYFVFGAVLLSLLLRLFLIFLAPPIKEATGWTWIDDWAVMADPIIEINLAILYVYRDLLGLPEDLTTRFTLLRTFFPHREDLLYRAFMTIGSALLFGLGYVLGSLILRCRRKSEK